MAEAGRDQNHLGIDTNVLVAYLDYDHPQHKEALSLLRRQIALNPTVIHEAYHTLVFKMKWREEEASQALRDASTDEDTSFINQSLRTTLRGLELAEEYHLGGRDALILASYIFGGIKEFVTFDEDLLSLKRIKSGRESLVLKKP